jgi:cell wall assembly regulator SMI1
MQLTAMARMLEDKQLRRFETLLHKHDVPIEKWTRPGLTEAQIETAIKPLGLRLPQEVRIWWRWRNGTIYGGRRKLPGPWHEAMSIEDAIEHYQQCRQVAINTAGDWPHNDPDLIWSPSWLPIIKTTQPVAVDCSVPEDTPTPVLHIDWSDLEHSRRPRACSIGEMVSWWIAALENDAWYWDEQDKWWRTRRERLAPELRTNPLV